MDVPQLRPPLNPRLSHWHLLAYQLRCLRERHDLSLAQVGTIINAARSTVSNVEAARLRIDERQARLLDERYGTGDLLQSLLYFACIGHDPEWQRQYGDYETKARLIRVYQGQVIPSPLQTEAYIKALVAESKAIDQEASIAARFKKQATILERESPPYIWVLIDESVLETEIGGRQVMRDQLQHLLDLRRLPNISVRVIPKSSGAHVGLDGPMRIISLASRDLAYVGARRGGRLVETPEEVRELVFEFDLIGQKAASEELSEVLIRKAMESMHDDRLA